MTFFSLSGYCSPACYLIIVSGCASELLGPILGACDQRSALVHWTTNNALIIRSPDDRSYILLVNLFREQSFDVPDGWARDVRSMSVVWASAELVNWLIRFVHPSLILRGEKWEIWPRVAFGTLFFPNGATYRKSETNFVNACDGSMTSPNFVQFGSSNPEINPVIGVLWKWSSEIGHIIRSYRAVAPVKGMVWSYAEIENPLGHDAHPSTLEQSTCWRPVCLVTHNISSEAENSFISAILPRQCVITTSP